MTTGLIHPTPQEIVNAIVAEMFMAASQWESATGQAFPIYHALAAVRAGNRAAITRHGLLATD